MRVKPVDALLPQLVALSSLTFTLGSLAFLGELNECNSFLLACLASITIVTLFEE